MTRGVCRNLTKGVFRQFEYAILTQSFDSMTCAQALFQKDNSVVNIAEKVTVNLLGVRHIRLVRLLPRLISSELSAGDCGSSPQ
jgi:hypothetical protein